MSEITITQAVVIVLTWCGSVFMLVHMVVS
jgi:hypothetical protein